MTRRIIIGLAIAGCSMLGLLPAALPQQAPPSGPPPAPDVLPPAAATQAQVKDVVDKARRRYGKGTDAYYRDVTRGLQGIVGLPPPVGQPPSAAAPAPGTAAAPTVPPLAAQRLFRDKNVRRLIDLALKERARTGRFSDVSERIIGGLPALPGQLEAPSIALPSASILTAAPAEITASTVTHTTGRGVPGALARASLKAGLKDMVVGLAELPATPRAEPSVSADPVDPYPEAVALGRGAMAPDPKSLCSGVLIGRSKDSQEGAVLTAAHCLRDQYVTHVYIGHNVFTTPLCTGAPDHDAGMPIVAVKFLNDVGSGPSGDIAGVDVAIAFFRKAAPPGYKHYFLDMIVKNATAAIPDPELLQILRKGLIKREDMQDSATVHARKLAQALGIELEKIGNDLVVQAQFNALVESVTPKKLPVGVIAVGFGATATTANRHSVGCKGWADFEPSSFIECLDDGGVGNCVHGREFVLRETEEEGGSDTCPGDSGGPVYMETRDGAGRYVRYLVGLTSRAVKPDQTTKCGGGEGGIYSLVARDEVIGFVTRALTDRGMLPNIASLAPPPTGLTNGQ